MSGLPKNYNKRLLVMVLLAMALSMFVADFALAQVGNRLRTILAQSKAQAVGAPVKTVKIRVLDDKDYAEATKGAKTLVLVDFYADWCGPCRKLSPTIQKLADQYDGKVVIFKVNVDKAPNLVRNLAIDSIPTVLILNQTGEGLERLVGPFDLDTYKGRLDQHLKEQEAKKKTGQ